MPQVALLDMSPEMKGMTEEENPQQEVWGPQWSVPQVHLQELMLIF